MGKLNFLFVIISLLLCETYAKAQDGVGVGIGTGTPLEISVKYKIEKEPDLKFVAALASVTAIQTAFESITNAYTDSIGRKLIEAAAKSALIFTAQKTHEASLKKTSEFEKNTEFYDYAHDYADRVKDTCERLRRAVKRLDVPNKSSYLKEVDVVEARAKELIDNYDAIVINGKDSIKGDSSDGNQKVDDGYNAMSRLERLQRATAIGKQLESLNGAIAWMKDFCEQADVVLAPSMATFGGRRDREKAPYTFTGDEGRWFESGSSDSKADADNTNANKSAVNFDKLKDLWF